MSGTFTHTSQIVKKRGKQDALNGFTEEVIQSSYCNSIIGHPHHRPNQEIKFKTTYKNQSKSNHKTKPATTTIIPGGQRQNPTAKYV